MQSILGEDYHAFIRSLDSDAPVSIRHNQFKFNPFKDGNPVPWCKEALYLPSRPEFSKDPFWHAGCYYVQESASMFIGNIVQQLITEIENPIVLDSCAAPGGKSTHLSSVLHENGLLVSNEVIKTRAHILQENCTKWGLNNVVITNNDPSHFSKVKSFFDILVVDAPCSGEGLFRKQPESVSEWSESAVEFCSNRQKRILEDLWPSLKPGGFLVYSTCTYNKPENEDNLRWLSKQYDVGSVEIKIEPEWNIDFKKQANLSTFRFYPHKTNSEGLFVTVVQKLEQSDYKNFTHLKNPYFHKINKEDFARLQEIIKSENIFLKQQPNGMVNLLPESFYEEIEFLATRLKVIYCGTPIAEVKGKDIIPMQGAANSIYLNQENFNQSDLDLDKAQKFLARQDFDCDAEIGINLVTFNSVPLGWIKKMPNRINNYFPQEWRLRNN
ncbi:MAG: hypothetical protein H7329_10640 [Opitutaceae bacterium]|nr:hypothetical protein [Cytophagales bacterium]